MLPRSTLDGTAPTSDASGAPVSERVDALVDAEDHARSTYPLVGTFFTLFCIVNLLLFATVGLAFSRWLGAAGARGRSTRPAAGRRGIDSAAARLTARPRGSLAVLRAAAVAVAAVPVATMLANLVPWWRVSAPSLALTGLVVAWVAVVTAAAVLPPWKRQVFGPAAVVAAVTAVRARRRRRHRCHVSRSPGSWGSSRWSPGASTASTTRPSRSSRPPRSSCAASIGDALVRRGQRRWAVVSIAATGSSPSSSTARPASARTSAVRRRRSPPSACSPSWRPGCGSRGARCSRVLAAGVVVVSLFAVVDWLRPPDQRTHLGAFVDDAARRRALGHPAPQDRRELLDALLNPLTLVAVGGILLVVIVVGRPAAGGDASPTAQTRTRG